MLTAMPKPTPTMRSRWPFVWAGLVLVVGVEDDVVAPCFGGDGHGQKAC